MHRWGSGALCFGNAPRVVSSLPKAPSGRELSDAGLRRPRPRPCVRCQTGAARADLHRPAGDSRGTSEPPLQGPSPRTGGLHCGVGPARLRGGTVAHTPRLAPTHTPGDTRLGKGSPVSPGFTASAAAPARARGPPPLLSPRPPRARRADTAAPAPALQPTLGRRARPRQALALHRRAQRTSVLGTRGQANRLGHFGGGALLVGRQLGPARRPGVLRPAARQLTTFQKGRWVGAWRRRWPLL